MARHRWDPIAPPAELTLPTRVSAEPGGLTRGRAAGPRWRRTARGQYVPVEVVPWVPEQRIAEVAGRIPAGAAITGWAAARLWGANFCDGVAPDGHTLLEVPVAVGHRGGTRRGGVRVSFERLPESDVVERHGIRLVIPERAVFDEVRAWDRVEAQVALEMAFAGRITSISRMADFAAAHRSSRRVQLVWDALGRASEHSLSPNEVRSRLVAEDDARLPRLLVNPSLVDVDGRPLGMVDLLDEAAGLVLEYDGADHRAAGRHTHDVLKEADLRDCGLEVVRVTGYDLRHRAQLAARIVAARGRAQHLTPAERLWRITERVPLPNSPHD